MQICPNCARERDDRDIICAHCGHTGTTAAKTPPWPIVIPSAPVPIPAASTVAVPDASTPQPGATAAPAVVGHSKYMTRNVLFGAVATGVAVAAAMFIMRSTRNDAHMNAAAAPAAAAARHAVVPVSESVSTAAPKWKRTLQSRWATDGSRTMGFEVEAEQRVAVYMDRVRPILAVRCVSRDMEVFVVLHSAASIENAGDTHTVRISLDGEADVDQQWLDSVDKQALFAPDAKALASRMAASRRLRFSFKPFNAAPATIDFDVHGFDEPLAAMSKTCDPGSARRPPTRS
jgi:hypothetical protein